MQSVDRQEFALRQAEMTATWADGVRTREGDPEAYFAQRRRAYLDRWLEALRFIPDGARLLDIGGGNGWAALYRLLTSRRIDYHYLDIDPASVAASSRIAAEAGCDPTQFRHGFNDQLDFPDGVFDAVFSSHCIEHSFDLDATFQEIRRVLKPHGVLTMAVPFGWEPNPEHPYFLGPAEWAALIQDAGFEIRTAQVGCVYPETGHDYFVCARRLDARPSARRIDPAQFAKPAYRFLSVDDAAVRVDGEHRRVEAGLIGYDGSVFTIDLPADARTALPILVRHAWSGIAEATWGGARTWQDLFSWFDYPMPLRLDRGGGTGALTLRAVGANPASHSNEVVLQGVLFR